MARKKTNEEFLKEIEEMVGDEYLFLQDYVDNRTSLQVMHMSKDCDNFVYPVSPTNFLHNKRRCPKCSKTYKDYEMFKKEVEEGTNNEYLLLSEEYVSSKEKVWVKHNVENCQNEWLITPNNFSSGKRCPQCNESKGEHLTRITLNKYIKEHPLENITFEQEYVEIVNDKTGSYLPVDFVILKEGKLIGGIEYDGIHHFETVEYFGGEKNYEDTLYKDNLKDNWFKYKNIPLKRIPYWEYKQIEGIVTQFMEDINS